MQSSSGYFLFHQFIDENMLIQNIEFHFRYLAYFITVDRKMIGYLLEDQAKLARVKLNYGLRHRDWTIFSAFLAGSYQRKTWKTATIDTRMLQLFRETLLEPLQLYVHQMF